VLHGHERGADAHDRVLGERKQLVGRLLGVAAGNLDRHLVDRARFEPCVA
jgi:hypothetical protein